MLPPRFAPEDYDTKGQSASQLVMRPLQLEEEAKISDCLILLDKRKIPQLPDHTAAVVFHFSKVLFQNPQPPSPYKAGTCTPSVMSPWILRLLRQFLGGELRSGSKGYHLLDFYAFSCFSSFLPCASLNAIGMCG
ncbi:hypothetical protein CEXT_586401 [Caerostris extrusa]|uniref:Uncharacterized protein n=1 Tax=Caerostris extrusa TaxID=172846 RepID=A0AAV4RDR2_CAEEX|nr:hypothetical protein CEXT_586401 [Caerostris extrusa]